MFIFGYAKALKETQEENQKLNKEIFDYQLQIINLKIKIEELTQKINKQKQELKNSTYIWK